MAYYVVEKINDNRERKFMMMSFNANVVEDHKNVTLPTVIIKGGQFPKESIFCTKTQHPYTRLPKDSLVWKPVRRLDPSFMIDHRDIPNLKRVKSKIIITTKI